MRLRDGAGQTPWGRRAVAALALLALLAAPGPVRATGAAATAAGARAQNYRDRNFDYFVAGDLRAARGNATRFLLALMGGGGSVDAAFRALARAAGNGHVVILRAVADDSFDPQDGDYGAGFATTWGPVAAAETIVFHHRDASYDPRVLHALAGADGIFIAGGDQSNYVRYWRGSPVEAALNAHVRAGRPIGGSSAGLAILGHYSYTAFDGGSLESKTALPDPCNSGVTLEENFLRLPFLEHVITDSHFSQRSRLGRLIVFVARLNTAHDDLTTLDIGIDEHTALLVNARGRARLAAGSAGTAWVVRATQPAQALSQCLPLTLRGVRVQQLGASSTLELPGGEATRARATVTLDVLAGAAAPGPLLAPILLRTAVPPDEP